MKTGFDKRLLLAAGLTAGLASVSGGASAQSSGSCADAISAYQLALTGSSFGSTPEQIVANHPACFGGSTASAQVQINATMFSQVNAISGALGSRFQGSTGPGPVAAAGTRGVAAGGAGNGFNVWGNLANADTRQNYVNSAANSIKSDSTVLSSVVGADYSLAPNFVVGVSAAFDRGDLSSQNVGGGGPVYNSTSKGYVIAPYAGYQLSKELALDASVGIGQGKLYSSGDVNSESDRWFGAANLSYNQWYGNVQLTGKLGYLHGEEKYGDIKAPTGTVAGTAAKSTIDQARLGVQAGYWLNGGFMPYAGLAYTSDLHRSTTQQLGATSDPIGKDAWVWTLGLNFFSLPSGVTAGLAYNQEEGRTNQKNSNLLANVNVRF